MAGIVKSARALAQHVIGIAKQLPLGTGRTAQCLLNRLAQHEMLPQ